jgi:glutamate dehydrogenase (NAD(P)+)
MFDRSQLLEGATEKDIVYAGLEEIMTSSTDEVIKTSLNRKVDLRTAAYVNAIMRLDEFYAVTGVN